jgi:hypothetical protein
MHNNQEHVVISEVIDACRGALQSYTRRRDKSFLPDIIEGLAISATKLEVLLKGNAYDKVKAQKVVSMLNGSIKHVRRNIRLATQAQKMLEAGSGGKYKMVMGTLISRKESLTTFQNVLQDFKVAMAAKENPVAFLRSWIADRLLAMREIVMESRPYHDILKEVEEQNGVKSAVQTINNIADYIATL